MITTGSKFFYGLASLLFVTGVVYGYATGGGGVGPVSIGYKGGVGDLVVGPKPITVPLDGADETGAICGFGPRVQVDGRFYDTAVDGFIGNVVSAGPLDLDLCDENGIAIGELDLSPGTHRLKVLSTEEFQPVIVALSSQARDAPDTESAASSRDFSVTASEPSRQDATIGPGEDSILRTTRNFNAGWVAELDGVELRPLRVDGWAQGWRVPQGEGGELEIRYGPERGYLIALFTGLAVAMSMLVLAFVVMLRTSPSAARQPALDEPVRSRKRAAGFLAAAAVPAWVLGGVPAALGLLLAALGVVAGRRVPALVLAAALLVAGPVMVALLLQFDQRGSSEIADVLAGTGLLLAFGTVLIAGRDRVAREAGST